MSKSIEIGKIGNIQGELTVKEFNGKLYWAIEDWDGSDWEEIPKYSFDSLIKFNAEQQASGE